MAVTAAASVAATDPAALGRARLAENFDTFLSLLTTQLKNQDPLSPLDSNQFTEQLLAGIRSHRAKVVVLDITGVPDVDSEVANHLVQAVDASRLMGASVILTGLSPEIAQTLVTIGVDLAKMDTVGDLQGGLEEAERLLGFHVIRTDATGNHQP